MVAAWKLKEIEKLTKRISNSKVVGLVDINGIPSRQFQLMRKKLAGKAEVRVSRINLIKRSFENAEIKGLDSHIRGSIGLVLTDLDPFKLNKILKENRISSPAKGGNKAPKDIVVPAGETSLPAGPIIGDIQKAGIKAQIKAGKISITEDSLVVKEGERISPELAMILTRLGIEPMEIGLKLNAAYEDGLIYTPDVLAIDEKQVMTDLQTAYVNALNLALNLGVYNQETIGYLLIDASRKALNLAVNAEIFNKETIKLLLSKAYGDMLSLASKVPDAVGEDLKAAASSSQAEEKTKEEKEKKTEKEEKSSEEDAASGLASLFG
ncbi:MAG: 50S ribosomal protein L10 [Candidatus Altiarchaeota archaeon]|nr:50S ribosomal protein L10 [Candidatus Altiarchaeota archaeon]